LWYDFLNTISLSRSAGERQGLNCFRDPVNFYHGCVYCR
jgi:hypothetical protein